jgi:hypothetical protein
MTSNPQDKENEESSRRLEHPFPHCRTTATTCTTKPSRRSRPPPLALGTTTWHAKNNNAAPTLIQTTQLQPSKPTVHNRTSTPTPTLTITPQCSFEDDTNSAHLLFGSTADAHTVEELVAMTFMSTDAFGAATRHKIPPTCNVLPHGTSSRKQDDVLLFLCLFIVFILAFIVALAMLTFY